MFSFYKLPKLKDGATDQVKFGIGKFIEKFFKLNETGNLLHHPVYGFPVR